MSVTSITVSLGIALFGVFIYLAAIALNLTAIQKKIHDPQRYNGLGLAIAGMAVCFFFLMVAASFFISGEFFLH